LVLRDRLRAHLEILIKVGEHNLLDLANEARRGRARFAPNQCKYGPAHHTLAPVVSMKKSRRLQARFARLLTSQSASPSLCAAAIDVLLAGGVRSNPFPFSAAP